MCNILNDIHIKEKRGTKMNPRKSLKATGLHLEHGSSHHCKRKHILLLQYKEHNYYILFIMKCTYCILHLHNDVVNRDVDELNKKSNKAHNGKSNGRCHSDFLKL